MIFFRKKKPQANGHKSTPTLGSKLRNYFRTTTRLDDNAREELEELLLLADISIDTCGYILQQLEEQLRQGDEPLRVLQRVLTDLLKPAEKKLQPANTTPWVVLVAGANGVGKTTTIAKLAHWYKQQGHTPLLAAADTFRAAAVEQLQVWAKQLNVDVVAQHTGADSAAVVFDAIEAARSRGNSIVLADTAGRLHNKEHLLEELAKVKRVAQHACAGAPHETLLTIDATTGQNAIAMTQMFNNAIGISALIMTKLDGSAKGGSVFTLTHRFALPIAFIGVGEQVEDLQPLDAGVYVSELLR